MSDRAIRAPGQLGKVARSLRDYSWFGMLPFIAVHLLPLGALWAGARPVDWAVCFALYVIRMFGVTGVYHRYFSHRTYKTSRLMQFLLALLAQSSSQKGVLWWASHHRVHHKYSDTPNDVHSPKLWGFWYAQVGWLYDQTEETDWGRIKDFARYPELRWLNKYWYVPPTLLGVAVWLVLGWSGLFIGFGLSTVLLWHGTFTINSLTHVIGTQRYDAGDESRNHWLLALITLGEGWHNNHHHYQACARQGFYWWEIDITYAILKGMEAVGLIWEIREPPARVYDPATHLGGSAAAGASASTSAAVDPGPAE